GKTSLFPSGTDSACSMRPVDRSRPARWRPADRASADNLEHRRGEAAGIGAPGEDDVPVRGGAFVYLDRGTAVAIAGARGDEVSVLGRFVAAVPGEPHRFTGREARRVGAVAVAVGDGVGGQHESGCGRGACDPEGSGCEAT